MLIDAEEAQALHYKKRKSNLRCSLPAQKYAVQNGVELNLTHCFALSSAYARTPIQILFDDQLLFVVGHYIVVHNPSLGQQQTYIDLEAGFSSVNCMAVAPLPGKDRFDKRALLAYSDNVTEIVSDKPHKRLFAFQQGTNKRHRRMPSAPKEATGADVPEKESSHSVFRGRVAIVGVNCEERHVLTHTCKEHFEIAQIELSDNKYCYILCENDDRAQVVHIWNFEKDVLLLSIDMKQSARKFALNPKDRTQV